MIDANSPKGLRYRAMTDRAIDIWNANWQEWELKETPLEEHAALDYVLCHGTAIRGLIEFKVRESGIDLSALQRGYRVILSQYKFHRLIELSDLFKVPSFFWVLLPRDGALLSWELYNPVRGRYADFDVEIMKTQTTTNNAKQKTDTVITLPLRTANPIFSGQSGEFDEYF